MSEARKTDARLESIWRKQRDEREYWTNEWLDGCGCENISVHHINGQEIQWTLIFDLDGKDAVLIETDSTAATAEESHKYAMLDSKIVEKLAKLYAMNPMNQAD